MAAAAPVIAIGVGLAASAASTIASTVSANKNADRNYQMQQEQYQYEKDLQSEIMDREDNAIQRQVADSRAAGISPILNMTGAQSSGAAGVAVNTPQRENTPNSMAAVFQGIASMSSLVQMYQQFKGVQTDNALAALDLSEKQSSSQTRLDLLDQSLTSARGSESRAQSAESRASEMHGITKEIQDILRQNAQREYQHKVDNDIYDSDSTLQKQYKGIFSDLQSFLGSDSESQEKMDEVSDTLLDSILNVARKVILPWTKDNLNATINKAKKGK